VAEAFLHNILEYKKALISEKKDMYFSYKWKAKKCARPFMLRNKLGEPGQIKLIAEVKKASPSRGLIRDDFDPVAIAKIYAENHASAVSVLTEDKYFLGKPEYVKQISAAVNIPVLVKDFIIDDGQIYEALTNGANAILLITAILDDKKLCSLIDLAHSFGLDCLVEIHNENELKRAVAAGAEIIGINNRDLHAFVVDMQTCNRLIPKVPKGKLIVGESGFKKYSQLKELKNIGANGVLIGETFMKAPDIGKKVKDVLYGKS